MTPSESISSSTCLQGTGIQEAKKSAPGKRASAELRAQPGQRRPVSHKIQHRRCESPPWIGRKVPHFPKSNWARQGLEGAQKQEGQLPNQGTCGLAAPAGGNAEHGRRGRRGVAVGGGRLPSSEGGGQGDDRRKWKEVGVASLSFVSHQDLSGGSLFSPLDLEFLLQLLSARIKRHVEWEDDAVWNDWFCFLKTSRRADEKTLISTVTLAHALNWVLTFFKNFLLLPRNCFFLLEPGFDQS